jgi:GH25 family lysozyme M1 (1,4-beta-N-acetylmuramidase)
MSLAENPFRHKRPKIIDVSHWEGYPDWDEVMAADDRPDGVICKASDYYGNIPFLDKAFVYSYPILKSLGVPRGAYHYYNGEYDPLKQAHWFLKCLGSDIGEYAPIIDAEKRDYRNWRGRWVRMPRGRRNAENLQTFLDVLERETGRVPMIYTSKSWVYEYLCDWLGRNTLAEPARYPLWIAYYPNDPDRHIAPPELPKGWTEWQLWQYSEAGVLKGFPFDGVDLNLASSSFADHKDETGEGGAGREAAGTAKQARVTSLASHRLNVRAGPGTHYRTLPPTLKAGTVVTVYETRAVGADEWVRIGEGRWCAKTFEGREYLRWT